MKIYKTDKCDTRTNPTNFTIEDVECDTLKHKLAVQDACSLIATKLIEQSQDHDYTKLGEYLPAFYQALKTGFKGKEFYGLDWWNIHTTKERHHLNNHCPDDVNLIDVIEMLCDCVCAGKARTGTIYPIQISNEILQKAVANTVEMLEREIEVIEK